MKRKILLVTLEGGGNIPPVMHLALNLAILGNEVTVLTEPCLEATVKSHNLNFIPFTEYFIRENRSEDIFQDSVPSSRLRPPVMERIMFGPAEIVARQTAGAIEKCNADLILVDCLLPAALIPAEAARIKSAIVCHMPEYLPGPNRPPGILGLVPGRGFFGKMRDQALGLVFNKILNQYREDVNEVRKKFRLEPLKNTSEALVRADLRLIQTLKSFDFPIEPQPANVRYTGPCLSDPDWAEDHSDLLLNSHLPLVVVSLSTTFQNQKKTLQNIIYSVQNLKVQCIVTLGPSMCDEVFAVSSNVILLKSASHTRLFPLADLVITHGGHGTIMRALYHGVPLLCMPMGRDQNDNAAKVVHHKIGMRLDPSSTPHKISEAIVHILNNLNYKSEVVKFQNELKLTNNSNEYLKEILEL